jgi:hypothetical protein
MGLLAEDGGLFTNVNTMGGTQELRRQSRHFARHSVTNERMWLVSGVFPCSLGELGWCED